MRVQLNEPLSREREQGAVAVIVALLLIVLLGFAAFITDFGLAYNNKRELQVAADGAALGAADYFADQSGDCASVVSGHGSAAEAVAVEVAEASLGVTLTEDPDYFSAGDPSHPADLPEDGQYQLESDCNYVHPVTLVDYSGALVVTFEVTLDTEKYFGQLVSDADPLTATRRATAVLGVPGTVEALRPYAMCSAAIPHPLPSGLIRVDYDGFVSTGECPEAHSAGNWWTMNCPEDFPANDTAGNTLNGCDDPVSLVPGQEPYFSDPMALSTHLLGQPMPCPNSGGVDSDCMGADTGNIRSSGVRNAWTQLLGEKIPIPVICGDDGGFGRPWCDPGAVHGAGGSNTRYPLHAFAGIQVCGHHFGNAGHSRHINTGDCAGASGMMLAGTHNYLVVRFESVRVEGEIAGGGCAIGDPDCDFGLRVVNLIE